LSFDATQDGLVAAFEQDGRKVKDVNVVTDRDTGRPRGFAFVEMANQADAEAAIQAMDGSELNGRPLKVSLAKERPSRGGGRDRP
jgi:RNA recognition motif-containing protein